MPRSIRIGPIPIELPNEVDAARIAYERSLGTGRLGIVGSFRARNRVRVVFRRNEATAVVHVGNRDYFIHPFAQAEGLAYWVGCEMELESVLARYEFAGIGLLVVLEREDASWEPVLRAEWERSRDATPGQHAQPHWHVYLTAAEQQARTRLLVFEANDWRVLGDELLSIDDRDVASAEQQSVARFHLAMASRWHLRAPNAQYESPDEHKVSAWISGCLEYTRGQLTYLAQSFASRPPF